MTQPQRVVIVGGGFGGLSAAQSLKNVPVQVSLIDRRNFHLFQPLLYQVATGWLSPANIASTLRATLKRQRNASVFLGEVDDINIERRRVVLSDYPIEYDILIVASGSRPFYFGNDHWRKSAPGLKTIEDATEIRRRIFIAFEAAERECGRDDLDALLTFAIVGGGPTGVELAGALGEIAHDTLTHDFRHIDPSRTRILLLEGGERILPTYAPELSVKAAAYLEKLGVTVRVNALVSEIRPEALTIKRGKEFEQIPCRTVIWAAGVQASPLGRAIAEGTGAMTDRAGRVVVEPDLTIAGHPEIFVIGDLANYVHQTGKPLPGVAPVAMQQGRYAARVIAARIKAAPIEPFRYRDLGNMAIVGHASAVAEMGRLRFSGYLAWLAWLFVHLVKLIEFENKVLVLIQWGWYYFSRNRAARLITGEKTMDDEAEQRAASNQEDRKPLSRAG
ncbi:MAG: NAD(P)/FAD-dependent oxidoreductase [Candidatus Binatia bacterium]